MPNLPAHIDLAHQAAKKLHHPLIDSNIAYFLFGSTSPDIRVITRKDREEYHFSSLDFEDVGVGVAGLFKAHPDLKFAAIRNEETQAFVAGYITHLIVDELWITTMYRPYFGNAEVFSDRSLGNVMDRAMQLELDRQALQAVTSSRGLLEPDTDNIDIRFIPTETLADWRKWVLTVVDRGFSWDRLRFMARRIARGEEEHPAYQLVEDFIQDMPASLDRLHEIVSSETVSLYKNTAINRLVAAVGEFLD